MRDQKTSNREAELTAPPRIGSGDLLGHSQRTKYMKTGDKVVCVDDSPCQTCGASVNVIKHQVYVVEHSCNDRPAISLIGIRPNCGSGLFYRADRFRLLDELKSANKQQQAQVA